MAYCSLPSVLPRKERDRHAHCTGTVRAQAGRLRGRAAHRLRPVPTGEGGGYADLVFFRDLESIDRVIEAEQNSDVCAAFFSIMDGDGSHRVYEVLKSYE